MGRDKALLRLDPSGPTMLEIIVSIARQLSDDVLVAAPNDRGYDALVAGARIVPDEVPGLGPIGGVITALSVARTNRVLLLPCDAPFLSLPLLRFLAERCEGTRPVVGWRNAASRQGNGRTLEVLHGVYPRAVMPRLKSMVGAGERQLFKLVEQLDPDLIGPDILSRYDAGLDSFRSLNNPDDLAAIDPDLFARRRGGLY